MSDNRDQVNLLNAGAEQSAPTDESHSAFRLDALSPGTENAGVDSLGAPKRSRLKMQTAFLAILIVAAIGVVFSMRQLGIGALTASGKLKMPEYDITQGASSKTADHQRLLKELGVSNVEAQVPPDQVQKNPFKLADAMGPDVPDKKADDKKSAHQKLAEEERLRRAAEAQQAKMQALLNSLELHSVMGGSNPIARISGRIYRVGDLIDETFEVKSITGRSVVLEAEGQTYTLGLDEPDNSAPGGGGGATKRRR